MPPTETLAHIIIMTNTYVSSCRDCPCSENICNKLLVKNMVGPACTQCGEKDCWILIACRRQTSHVHAFPIGGLCQHVAALLVEQRCTPRERAAVEFCKSEPDETAFNAFVDRSGSCGPPCYGCGFLRTKKAHKLCVCSRCRDGAYCDRQCQKADWPKHKQDCGKTLDPKIRTEQECECFTKKDRHLASSEAQGHCSRPFCLRPLPAGSRLTIAVVKCKNESTVHKIQLRHCSHACRRKHAARASLTGSATTKETLGWETYRLAQDLSRARGLKPMEEKFEVWLV